VESQIAENGREARNSMPQVSNMEAEPEEGHPGQTAYTEMHSDADNKQKEGDEQATI
jgi:hypothetical protein